MKTIPLLVIYFFAQDKQIEDAYSTWSAQ